MKNVYVGCSLTDAPLEFRAEVSEFKEALKTCGFEVLEFLGLTGGTPEDVVLHDTGCVQRCDLFIAICTYPSTGLGMEIGFAFHFSKTVVAAVKEETKVTRMVTGFGAIHSKYQIVYYRSLSDLLPIIAAMKFE